MKRLFETGPLAERINLMIAVARIAAARGPKIGMTTLSAFGRRIQATAFRFARRLPPLVGVAVTACLWASTSVAQFTGTLAFEPDDCMARRACTLKSPLRFVDPNNRVWQADVGDVTDGASIPDWAQSVIGMPWDESFLKAAVLHDHYCGKRIASWRDTHLMFYNALIELGVNAYKAKLMYYAVYVAGPRWIDVVAPICGPGTTVICGGGETLKTVDQVAQGERYDSMDLHREMSGVARYMDENPDTTIDQLHEMAKNNHPEDLFLRHGDALRVGEPLDQFMKSMKQP